jgi:hypothetical protein
MKRKPKKKPISKATRKKISVALKKYHKKKTLEKARQLAKRKATGKKISKALKRYYKTKLTKQGRAKKRRIRKPIVLVEVPTGQEIPAFQMKDQVEADPGMESRLDAALDQLKPDSIVFAEFTVSKFGADGTMRPETKVTVPVTVTDPADKDQFWRDFYNDVRDDLEDELYGEDAGGGSSAVTCSSVVG